MDKDYWDLKITFADGFVWKGMCQSIYELPEVILQAPWLTEHGPALEIHAD